MVRTLSDRERVSAHVLAQVPTATPETTVGDALERLRKEQWDSVHYVYVLDPQGKLLGIVSIRELLWSKDSVKLREIMKPANVHVSESADQEHIAIKALEHNLKSVSVLQRGTEKFLGAVPSDKILSILHEEHTEDLLRAAGIQRTQHITDIFHESVLRLSALRIGWLLVGLIGGMLTTLLVESAQAALERNVALAFFIPVLVYMSDAVGTQTETLYIRAITLKKFSHWLYLLKELTVGTVLGVVLAALMGAFALTVMHIDPRIVLTVTVTMFLSVFLATGLALLIPSILSAFKRDAAFASGPLATVLQDFLTLLIYFIVAHILL